MPPAIPAKNWQLTIGDVPATIYLGPEGGVGGFGIRESIGVDGRRASVYFQCLWSQRNALIKGLLGTVSYVAGTVTRTAPSFYPVSAADNGNGLLDQQVFCTDITSVTGTHAYTDSEGLDTGQAGWIGYGYAIVQAEFTSPPYQVALPGDGPAFNDMSGQTYCISKARVSGEVFSPPTGAFVFAGGAFIGDKLLDVGAAQIRTRYEYSITRVRMPIVPIQVVTALIGTVNLDPLTIAGQDAPKGTVLFTGINPEPRQDPYSGGIIYDVEFTFMVNGPGPGNTAQLDWNYFLDPGGSWSPITTAAGQPVFQYDPLQLLLGDVIS
jgi:hypothetical protein